MVSRVCDCLRGLPSHLPDDGRRSLLTRSTDKSATLDQHSPGSSGYSCPTLYCQNCLTLPCEHLSTVLARSAHRMTSLHRLSHSMRPHAPLPWRPTAKAFTSTWGEGASPHTLVTTPWFLVYPLSLLTFFCLSCRKQFSALDAPFPFVGETVQSRDKAGTRLYTPETRSPLFTIWLGRNGRSETQIPAAWTKNNVREKRKKMGPFQRPEMQLLTPR